MIFTFDIELWFNVTVCSPFTNKQLMSQIGVDGENFKSGFFIEIWYELDPGPRNSTSFNQRHSVVEIRARLGQVERKYASDKFVRQTDGHISGWKDGQTDHYRVPAEWGIIWACI